MTAIEVTLTPIVAFGLVTAISALLLGFALTGAPSRTAS